MAMNVSRQRATKAGKVHAYYLAHPRAQFIMIFEEFRNPARRNKLLAERGHEPVILPWETPGASETKKRRRRRRKAAAKKPVTVH